MLLHTAGLSDTTNATRLYGHPAYTSYKAKSYTLSGDEQTSSYYATEPTYIVQEAADPDKFAADNYSYEDITSAQRSFFDKWERIGTNKWLVSLKEKIAYGADNDGETIYPKFSTINGFKVIFFRNYDESYTELNATITKFDDGRTVLIELPSYYEPSRSDGTIELWVGSGTTITGNTLHPTQKTFGSFADVSKGVVSGYVKITDLSTSKTGGFIWGGSDKYPDFGGGSSSTEGGGTNNPNPSPSDDVNLADTRWYGYDGEMSMSMTISFYSYGRFSVDISYYNDEDFGWDNISGTYSVSENYVSLYVDGGEELYGFVNEDNMTLYRYDENGEKNTYYLMKDY